MLTSEHDWVAVATGGNFSVARKRDGGALVLNPAASRNELGHGPGPNTVVPKMVGTNHDWRDVAASGASTLALRADGTLWIWGEEGRVLTLRIATAQISPCPPGWATTPTGWP